MNSRYLLFIVFALWAFFSHGQAFYLDSNGVTIKCPLANVGDTGVVGSTTYVKLTERRLLLILLLRQIPLTLQLAARQVLRF